MIKVDNGCGIVARLRGIAASEVEAQFALNVKCCASADVCRRIVSVE